MAARDVEAELEREYRVEMVVRVGLALVDGRMPDTESAAFVGSALLSWLHGEGGLVRDCLRLAAPRGSHRRPDVVARDFLTRSSAMKRDNGCRVRDADG